MLGPSPCSPLAQAVGIEALAAQPGVADHRRRITDRKVLRRGLVGQRPTQQKQLAAAKPLLGSETACSGFVCFVEGPAEQGRPQPPMAAQDRGHGVRRTSACNRPIKLKRKKPFLRPALPLRQV